MLFDKGISIKTILCSSGTGRSLIPSLRQLVYLTVEDFLKFYMTMFADYCPLLEIPDRCRHLKNPKDTALQGTVRQNKEWAAGMYHLLAICGLKHDGKLCLAYGRGPEYAMNLHGHDHIMNPRRATTCMAILSPIAAAAYPYLETTTSNHIKVSDRTGDGGTIIRVQIADSTGAVRATTYMGIMEHITASQASSTASSAYQKRVHDHHKRCLDVVHNGCYDKTVTILPSSFCGMHTDAQGDEMFPDPFLPCYNHDQLLIRSIESKLVHVQHYRPPDPTCGDYFTVHCIILAFKLELKVQLRVRLYIVLSQIILAHDTRKIIVMKAYP